MTPPWDEHDAMRAWLREEERHNGSMRMLATMMAAAIICGTIAFVAVTAWFF